MTIAATVEARMTSSRLPGKMTLPINGKPALAVLIERLKRVPELDHIVLATTTNSTDDVLVDIARDLGVSSFRGSEDDVLGRVRAALDSVNAEICVEITGDCPLTDPAMVSTMIGEFFATRSTNGYVGNTTGPTLGAPHGLDVQVFEVEALRKIDSEYRDPSSREHVSMPFYRDDSASRWHPRFVSFFPDKLCRQVWFSLDYREDYELIRDIYEDLVRRDPYFNAQAMIDAGLARPNATRRSLALRGWSTPS